MTGINPQGPYAPWGSLPPLARLNLAVLAGGIVGLVALLLPVWRRDPDLSYAFAVPPIFVALVWESRRASPPRFLRRSRAGSVLGGVALALGAGAVALAGLSGSALGADHAATCLLASGGLALILLAAWRSLAERTVGVISFGWPAVVALALWPLSAPPPPGSSTRLLLALQGEVAAAVAGTLGLLGIAAYRDGNVIQLAQASVGVSEACSGVRSLMASLAAALFLSAVVVKRPWARAVLIIVAPLLALVMNFVRSLILVLATNFRGRIGSGWHDRTGFALIGGTTVLLGMAALAIRGSRAGSQPAFTPAEFRRRPRQQAALAVTLGSLVVLLAALAVARRPRNLPRPVAPDLASLFPAAPEGWSVQPDETLARYSGILQTSFLARKTYATADAAGPLFVTFYVAYWLPNQASVSLVDAHTPDFCWPGTGWVAQPSAGSGSQGPRCVDGRVLPGGESRLFSHAGDLTRVWFWHLYAGRPLIQDNPYSVRGFLRQALTSELHHGRDQLLVVVSSNRAWSAITPVPIVGEFFRRVAPLGL